MNYAIVADGVVVNVIWVRPDQAEECPGAVPGSAGIGDLYVDGAFIHVDAGGGGGGSGEPEIQTEGEQPA
jgi:hypothetical protein